MLLLRLTPPAAYAPVLTYFPLFYGTAVIELPGIYFWKIAAVVRHRPPVTGAAGGGAAFSV